MAVVECQMLAYLNSQANLKYLQYGTDKCYKIHVGLYKEKLKCSTVYVDGWETKEVNCLLTGQTQVKETLIDQQNITETNVECYLGDYI